MASGGKSKAPSGGGAGGGPEKKRRVAFSADVAPVSCNANESLKLHVVLEGQELQVDDEEYTFDPEFAERIFGEDGKIYGYKDLKIDLWLHAATFHAYVQIQYSSKSAGGKKSTDVLGKLKEVFGDGLTEDRDSFKKCLLAHSQDFQQLIEKHGEFVSSWTPEDGSVPVVEEESTSANSNDQSKNKPRKIVRVELADPAVRDLHARLTPLCLCFIEGAQPIESDDPLWEVYLALEGEGPKMKVAGFCNVYCFYHYPDSTRLRISQILVLPPYQGSGFGLHLLESVNATATARSCYDVTMEEPSVVLQKLRDTMDVLRFLSLPSIDEAIKDALRKLQLKKNMALSRSGSEISGDQSGALINVNGSNLNVPSQKLRQGSKGKSLLAPPAHLVEEVRENLKVSKMQFKRCWEQLLFMYLDPTDRHVQDVFQEALVQRLNLEIFEKDSGNKGVGKRVVDTDNEYDSSKTFVMMRNRKIDSVDGSGAFLEEEVAGDEVQALTPGPEEKGKILQEELREREDELQGVAQSVSRHCRALGFDFPSLKIWEQAISETSELAS
ncbi:unnamed protein product [Calypogeia fissa]